jgi:hypothetical protein
MEVTLPDSLIIQTYFAKPGDLDIKDRPALPEIEDAKAAAAKHLESYVQKPIKGRRQPQYVQVIDHSRNVHVRYRLMSGKAYEEPI